MPELASLGVYWTPVSAAHAAAYEAASRGVGVAASDKLLTHQEEASEVVRRACDVVAGARTDGPVLVWAQHLDTQAQLEERLRAEGLAVLTLRGNTTARERSRVVEAASSGSCDVLLVTDVAGRGMNLQQFATLVSVGCSWNPATEHQRIGRIRRLGSPHRSVRVPYVLADIPGQHQKWRELDRKRRQAAQLVTGL
jgi:superfamily II DNA/RNA helicase